MNKTILIKLILIPTVLASLWMGGSSLQNTDAQTPSVPQTDTDLNSTSPDNATTSGILPPEVDPDSSLAQIIRLLQAGVEQSVILTYISNSTSPFNLNSDEIIYLNDLGAPPEMANAMMQHDQQVQPAGTATNSSEAPPSAAAGTTEAPPIETTVSYFYNTLAPYGVWANLDGYGWCWRPTIVVYSNGWLPYCNNGHWVYSDCGWYWISGYSWGWAPFHYGRWFHHPHYGWCWWPDTTWAPSWVCWRYNQNYCGWAPLPPHAVYQSGVGLVYQGQTVSAGFDFGLAANAFTFVATKNFCDPHLQRNRVGVAQMTQVYDQTSVFNNLNFDNHQQGIVNPGIPPQNIAAATRQAIHPVTILAGNGSPAWNGPREQFQYHGNTLIVNRPHFIGTPVLSLRPGTPPTAKPGQNQFQPMVRGNGNNTPPGPANQTLNNPPHQDINQNPHQNFTQTLPRMPQTQQPQNTYVVPSTSQANNQITATPPQYHQSWPAQNQVPNNHYNSDGRTQSPRQFGSRQPSPPDTSYDPKPQGNTVIGQPASNSSADNHYSSPRDGSRNNNQSANHSGATQPNTQPHASYSSSSSSGSQGQNQGNSQNGH